MLTETMHFVELYALNSFSTNNGPIFSTVIINPTSFLVYQQTLIGPLTSVNLGK